MPKTRPPYTPEFRRRLIELVRKGRTPEDVGRQFEPSAQTVRNWLRQADRDAGRRTDGPTTDEQEAEARLVVFDFIEGWYNPHRRHFALDYESPNSYERKHDPAA